MKIKLHRFKPSGKWYDEFEADFPDGLSFLELMERIDLRHSCGVYDRHMDILYIGDQHPMGFPFISRAITEDSSYALKARIAQLEQLLALEQKHLTTTQPCSTTTLNTK